MQHHCSLRKVESGTQRSLVWRTGNLLDQFGHFRRRCSFLLECQLGNWDITNDISWAHLHAHWLSSTMVTLEHLVRKWINGATTERAGNNAQCTANTFLLIDRDQASDSVLGYRVHRAYVSTDRNLALLTGHRNIKTLLIPLDHMYPRPCGCDLSLMHKGAPRLTHPAACALLRFNNNSLVHVENKTIN